MQVMIKQQQDQLRQEYEGKLANLEREREGIGEWVIYMFTCDTKSFEYRMSIP